MILAWTCLEPLPGNFSAYALGTSLEVVIAMTTVKGIGRNVSRGGLPELRSHFSISRYGAQPRFLVVAMVKMKAFSG